ncbi:MAG: phosphoribosylglycinamide formyltransferase [Bdellovibrionales bacterium]|nr:phosphoribosylglycinamide formyltransferase [Bdellovibrionales bacterium]
MQSSDISSNAPRIRRTPIRLVMLASGAGTTVSAFCEAGEKGQIPAQVVAVITNESKAGVISVAEEHQVPCSVIQYQKENVMNWDQLLLKTIKKYDPDLILLAGFLKKIGPVVLSHFKNRIVNSHPALLPEFSGLGMYGSRVHTAVIAHKKTETGVTIHLVNENYDEGRILAQRKLPVFPKETPSELEKRVKTMEKDLYIQTVKKILSGDISL